MLVMIENRLYDSDKTPIIIGLTSLEKGLIKDMRSEDHVFASFDSDTCNPEDVKANMEVVKSCLS